MIFVTLGTQDKEFKRLLDAVEKINTKEKIIAQIGQTKYSSKKMEIHKYLTSKEFDKYIKEARVIITHAGVGNIIEGLKYNKKMIVAARKKEYKEHVNNHQEQILKVFSDEEYIIPLENFDDLEYLINKDFTPKKFVSNNKNFVKNLDDEIKNLTSKNKRKKLNVKKEGKK